jgi:hypothetical protein
MKVQGVLFLLWFIVVGIWMTNQFKAQHLRAEKEKKALKDNTPT